MSASTSQDLSKRRLNSDSSSSRSFEKVSVESEKQESLFQSLISGYKSRTNSECKSIDAFLVFTMLTGVAQLIYCFLTKGYPYNAFIGVFSASIGSFVFAANARLQMSRKETLSKIDKVNLITEFLVCSIVLNIFVANFIG